MAKGQDGCSHGYWFRYQCTKRNLKPLLITNIKVLASHTPRGPVGSECQETKHILARAFNALCKVEVGLEIKEHPSGPAASKK